MTPAPAATPTPTVGAGAAIKLTGVSRRYGDGNATIVAVDEITLSIGAGEAIALMGPSGSGKSTLLHLIGAMDRPTNGTIHVNKDPIENLDHRHAAAYRRQVGFVFQRFHLLAALSLIDNILAPLLPLKLKNDPEPRARELLDQVGLAGREHATPGQLSGGQQQRVAIARALVNDPIVVLADEPTGNLDTSTGNDILTLLLTLRAQQNTTLLIATHDPTVAEQCDRTIHLADGKMRQHDQAA